MIDAIKLNKIMLDCLFLPEEMTTPDVPPEGAVIVSGITINVGFHPVRLESHRAEIATMILDLPTHFRNDGPEAGQGWSFLNLCMDRDGKQWTGMHSDCEALTVLSIGLGLAKFTVPRELWSVLPGGVPYIVFDLGE